MHPSDVGVSEPTRGPGRRSRPAPAAIAAPRLPTEPMTTEPQQRARSGGTARVLAYYAGLALLTAAIFRYVPGAAEILSGTPSVGLAGDVQEIFGPDAPPAVGSAVDQAPWRVPLLGALSMLGALAIMVPVTWVYMLTRSRRGYDESILHTLLILPVAVTGIVMIVHDSVALAFSLAGIVAAVRFRTTLEDTKDAVYVFLAIGVGLASGVHALGLALVLSLVFNAVILVLWVTNFGNVYARRNGRSGRLGLGDVLAGPGSADGALAVGDPAVLEAASPSDLAEVAERAVRMERHISEERAKKKGKRANALILVHASQAGPAQDYVERLLEDLATRWKLAEVGPGPRGFLLEYLARLDVAGAQGAVMDRLRQAPAGLVEAAELRSLEGLRPRA